LIHFLDGLPRSAKKITMVVNDGILIVFSLWLALSLRFGEPYTEIRDNLFLFIAIPFFTVPVFARLGLYHAVIRYTRRTFTSQLTTGIFVSAAILLVLTLLNWPNGLPRSTFAIYGFIAFVSIGGSRAMARRLFDDQARSKKQPALILGAGSCGRQVAGILRSGDDYRPFYFLDDDPRLIGHDVDGLRVFSPDAPDLEERVRQLGIETLFLAIPSASRAVRRKLLLRVEHLPVHVYTVPPLRELLSGEATVSQLREVSIEDLLGRDQVPPDERLLAKCIKGRSVLVTGAGGSIGAELCRQALALAPRVLVLYERSEHALFEVEQDLRGLIASHAGDAPEVVSVLGSVLDPNRLRQCLQRYCVETIYHTAAYKHVPIVEHNPVAGLQNNVIGTEVVASEAARAGVRHFVLISTDKAVRPTNVMGATKRLAELIVQDLARSGSGTCYSMVRFGNVLGSSGSVIPLFRKQIEQGGPVTVTSPEITRYFMTIPEAVQLVIQAGAIATGGDVFVLDMGDPVRIYDLARHLIYLSGYEVRDDANLDGDIEIVFTGLRPGEKLYEELLIGDNVSGTAHPKIMRAMEDVLDHEVLEGLLDEIRGAIHAHDVGKMRDLLIRSISGYQPQGVAIDVSAYREDRQAHPSDLGAVSSELKH
jgi:FlaA1/EpsC-like NDP-sugar epimerase